MKQIPGFQLKAEEDEPQSKKPAMMSKANRDTLTAKNRGKRRGSARRRPIHTQRGTPANRPRAQINGGQLMQGEHDALLFDWLREKKTDCDQRRKAECEHRPEQQQSSA